MKLLLFYVGCFSTSSKQRENPVFMEIDSLKKSKVENTEKSLRQIYLDVDNI